MGFSQVYHSSYKSGRRIDITKISFEHISEVIDEEGRFVTVTGKTDDMLVTRCNIYASPGSDFFPLS